MAIQKTTYIIIGLQRSGNHAIINWILKNQIENNIIFLNNCRCYKNPFEYCNNNISTEYSKHLDIEKELIKPTPKDILAISYEDCPLEECLDKKNFNILRSSIGSSDNIKVVLILRDPFNFFASRYISERNSTKPHIIKNAARLVYFQLGQWLKFDKYFYKENNGSIGNIFKKIRIRLSDNTFAKIPFYDKYNRRLLINLYKSYCREFLKNENIIPINFNLWYKSHKYRNDLANKLGISANDIGFNHNIVGSNFDNKLAPLERWKHFQDDHFYLNSFKDKELISLTRKIFCGTMSSDLEQFLTKNKLY